LDINEFSIDFNSTDGVYVLLVWTSVIPYMFIFVICV